LKASQTVPLEGLHESPYAEIICYPKLTISELEARLKELKKLKITALQFMGKKQVHNTPVLGKGCVGIVVKAFTNAQVIALKIRRTDANRTEMTHEAQMLKKANKLNIGPKLLATSKNFLLMQHIEGTLFPEWLQKTRNKQRIRNALRLALEQCYKLDKAGLDHGELSHAPKHIIIKPDSTPTIIDFETASTNRKTQNLTSLCQYFFIADHIARTIAQKLGNINKEKLKQTLRNYKQTKTRESFNAILKTARLIVGDGG
jgi:putative serine/threonine protein kinase